MKALFFSNGFLFPQKAFGGDFDDYIEGNDGNDIIVGDFASYDTWESSYPKHLLTINCSLGGNDTLHGGDGDIDLIVGGSWNDKIFADDSLSTNIDSSDVVFGDQAEVFFYGDESHRLQNATTADAGCTDGGSDRITLGPGDDLVSLRGVLLSRT